MPTKATSARGDAPTPRKRKRDTSPSEHHRQNSRIFQRAKNYEYNPLTTATSIRILELQPGEGIEFVECKLSNVERDQAPPYEAISYAWGSPVDTRIISCEGRKLKVTTNLRDALRQIRDPVDVKLLWADAICIDQTNQGERGHQVKQMGFIYANAVRVLVWLGTDHYFENFELDFGP